MKYEIHVNQRAIIEHGFDLDLVDGAIMDFCRFFSGSSGCGYMIEDGKRYYWFSHKLICEQLPILRLKPDSAYRRMKGLCDKLFLEAHPKNKQKNASWYCFGKLADLLVGTIGPKSEPSEINPMVAPETIGNKSEPTDQNPMPYGLESDGPTDQNPMYKEIIDKEINYKEKEGAIADALPTIPPEKMKETTLEEKKETPPTPDSGRPPSPKKSTDHLFRDSPFYNRDQFVVALTGTDYEIYDLPYYHETLKNWADSGSSAKYKKTDWIATARGFMLRDARDNRAKFRQDLQPLNNSQHAISNQRSGYPNGRAIRQTDAEFAGAIDALAEWKYGRGSN